MLLTFCSHSWDDDPHSSPFATQVAIGASLWCGCGLDAATRFDLHGIARTPMWERLSIVSHLLPEQKYQNWFDVVHVMVSFLAYCLILKKQQEKQGISACSQGLANLRCCLFLSNGHCCALVVSMWRLWAGLDPQHTSHLVFVVDCCRGAAFPGGAVSGLARIHLDVIDPTDGQCSSTLSIPGHLQLSWCCCGYIWKRWS